jgi:protein disulfide-isomerase A6
MVYESGERSASAIFKWVSLRVPNHVDKVPNAKDIDAWEKKVRAICLIHMRCRSLNPPAG